MTIIAFRAFGGEIPRQQESALPENASQDATNVDLAHGELRGMRGDAARDSGTTIQGAAIKSVYTEDGVKFYGWPYDAYVVRSMVVEDIHSRIYYTYTAPDGPLAKVARTRRNDGGAFTDVIGNLVPKFYPPEYTTPGQPYGSGSGPDSWVLGVPAPAVQAGSSEENLAVTLEDREEWPNAPALQLRVTLFYEDPAGNIVYQQDISNYDIAEAFQAKGYRNVFYNSGANTSQANRGNRMQDMMWQLGNKHAPYKYYYFDPAGIDLSSVTSLATFTNPGPGVATFTYTTSAPVAPGIA